MFFLIGCSPDPKSYSLSAHSNRASDIENLIGTWAICSSCLEHNICINNDTRNICNNRTIPNLLNAIDVAVSMGNILAVRYLIEVVGIDVNTTIESSGETLLHISAYYSADVPKYYAVMKYLLDNGADVNAIIPSNNYPTPLEMAVWKNNHAGIKLLGEYGAFKNQNSLIGACRTAIAHKKSNIVPLLPRCCEIALDKELPKEYQDTDTKLACNNSLNNPSQDS